MMVLYAKVAFLFLGLAQYRGSEVKVAAEEVRSDTDEDAMEELATFANPKSELCPYGAVYREVCRICFCIEDDLSATTHCQAISSPQECDTMGSPCDNDQLLYGYNRQCEGECECNAERNITTCERLPCDNNLLWFHGYYNKPEPRFPNTRSKSCPHGVIYREGCSLCFCIKVMSEVRLKCVTGVDEEECAAVASTAHCDPQALLYDYKAECEGECSCNEARNITTCANLPCEDNLLWFHEYYDLPSVQNEISEESSYDARAGYNGTDRQRHNSLHKAWGGRGDDGYGVTDPSNSNSCQGKTMDVSDEDVFLFHNRRTDKCPWGNVYRLNQTIMCFCVEDSGGFVHMKCDTKKEKEQIYPDVNDGELCPTRNLVDYKQKCEGKCECIDRGRIIVCDNFPCQKISLLWFHDLYNLTGKGVTGVDVATTGSSTWQQGTTDVSKEVTTPSDEDEPGEKPGRNTTTGPDEWTSTTNYPPDLPPSTLPSLEKPAHINKKSKSCPYGNFYRENCKLCYCVEVAKDLVIHKCVTRMAAKECDGLRPEFYCDLERISNIYDYDKSSEGNCECSQDSNMALCEYLPCDDPIVWFHSLCSPKSEVTTPSDEDEPGEKPGRNTTTGPDEWTSTTTYPPDLPPSTLPSLVSGRGSKNIARHAAKIKTTTPIRAHTDTGLPSTTTKEMWTGIHIVMKIDEGNFVLQQSKPKDVNGTQEISFHVVPKNDCKKRTVRGRRRRRITSTTVSVAPDPTTREEPPY